MSSPIRVLVADDDPEMRAVLADVVNSDPRLKLIGLAQDAVEAINLARRYEPDVALLDVKMPGGGGGVAAREIHLAAPATAILAFTAHEDETSVSEMLTAGATSYLVKGTSPQRILDAIHGSMVGRSTLSDSISHHVVTELSARLSAEQGNEQQRRQWHDRIKEVVDGEGALTIAYQPIVWLDSGKVFGLEALSRFRSEPSHGPDVWFAQAAALGLGVELEIAAISAAVAPLSSLPPALKMGLNVSPETILSSQLSRALEHVAVDRLVLEITEHAHISDYPRLNTALAPWRSAGVRLAIDDAGAGYASFRHILELAPDSIKMDISLTRDVNSKGSQRALAAALVAFAGETGARIVAEGIETAEELATLRDLGVALGQGYFLRRPEPLPADLAERSSPGWMSIELPPA
ncbi:MAG: EAL domain-containing protein [Acidimicrobiales bacterium]|jgi:EAL domain-containing protein (putative c-di-GMP-specific phosphodiesterase class I)